MAKQELGHVFKSAWDNMDAAETKKCMDYAVGYKKFLDTAKTERESAVEIVRIAEENGYKNLDDYIKKGTKIKAGDKVYSTNRGKAVVMFHIGKNPIKDGINIVGSHIDVPRLDIKPFPLYEDSGLTFLKTHYYGGIKKYQWTTIPLALHGVVFTKDGSKIDFVIGEDENEPAMAITDLLPHLGKDQMKKPLSTGIEGEDLNVLIGNIPNNKADKEKVKNNILRILKDKYDIEEADFMTAEIEVVPAGRARDVGLDNSMIGAYGHDDRSCTYAGLTAILDLKSVGTTAVAMFMDKEEVGSNGNTGSASVYFENTVAELIALQEGNYNELYLKRCISNTQVLSADVGAAFDPNFPTTHDKRNSSYLGNGIQLVKYTGSGGKYSCSDANAEFLSEVAMVFNKNDVTWQIGELGKVDQGGGGTIAFILANSNADVLDCGIPVLSMHSPMEILSKADLYMGHKAYHAFLNR